ncbi:MAG: metal ABC transporter permease [Deltaproteobacteria bacterium]|nr:metal ABC transporter permease [Deltaproteobacteria bacterium]MBW2086232.1 metal ABC transporter permease [Deltaproteobacteria bacterium]
MLEALSFEFMRNALLAGLLAGITCGIIGTFVVVNRIVFISGGIAHAAYGGVGLAFFLGLSPLVGILGFSLFVSFLMAMISLKTRHRADTVIGVLWAVGMGLGVILIDLTPGYNVDLMSYLFGSILTVPASDLWIMLVINILIILIVGYFYHDLVAMSYDEEFAQVRGVPVRVLYFMLMAMIALSVVMIVQVVGLILVIALLTIPPYIAEKFSGSMLQMMIYSILLNLIFSSTGLWLSFTFNLTSGASIIMVAAACFFFVLFLSRFWPKTTKWNSETKAEYLTKNLS